MTRHDVTIAGHAGTLHGYRWSVRTPRWIAVLCHGYGEHLGRYDHVADHLNAAGADVFGADHVGHGRSDGDRVVIEDVESVVDDLDRVVDLAADERPDLPIVLIGHSMGGLIAARYAQRHGDRLAALVLSGPVLGAWGLIDALLGPDEIPSTPVDPLSLSRDPAVSEAYATDELIWHGDFQRPTLEALRSAIRTVSAGGDLGDLPVLYLHGEADSLVPIGPSREGLERIRSRRTSTITYPGARHEIFNEINRDDVLDDVTTFVQAVLTELSPQSAR